MLVFRRQTWVAVSGRHCLAWLALAGHLLAVVGMPLPVRGNSESGPVGMCGCSRPDCRDQCSCASRAEAAVRCSSPRPSCCKNSPGKCSSTSVKLCPKCHSDARNCCCKKSQVSAAAGGKLVWVPGVLARPCHTQGSLGLASAPALPPAALVTWTFDWTLVGTLALASAAAGETCHCPPAPPPRG